MPQLPVRRRTEPLDRDQTGVSRPLDDLCVRDQAPGEASKEPGEIAPPEDSGAGDAFGELTRPRHSQPSFGAAGEDDPCAVVLDGPIGEDPVPVQHRSFVIGGLLCSLEAGRSEQSPS